MAHYSKPKIVRDIQRKSARSAWSAGSERRINLAYTPQRGFSLPWRRILRGAFVAGGIIFLVIGSVSAPTSQTLAQTSDQTRADLEAQLKQLQAEMDQAEQQRLAASKQGKTLSADLAKLSSNISALNTQIKAINVSLTQLSNKIGTTQSQIDVTSASLAENRVVLGSLMEEMYKNDRTSLLEIFLKNNQLSDFFTDANNVAVVQDNVRSTIGKIASLQDQLEQHEQDLTATKSDVELAKEYQVAQKSRVQQVSTAKQQLLTVTKGQEALYQKLYAEKKAAADKIRARLFDLLGGGQINFGQAYQYASLAANATGVRTALILAVLDHESALGRNVGKCSYKDAMSPTRDIPVFLDLMQKLGMDPDSVKVSCAIPSDGAYGGAMGPAQFIPSTWAKYSDRIASATGHSTPSPWNNTDAFMATALYMRDAGAAGGNVTQERIAAAKYYAGGNWSKYLYTYGEAVIQRAAGFEDDIAALLAGQ